MKIKIVSSGVVCVCLVSIVVWLALGEGQRRVPKPLSMEASELAFSDMLPVANDTANIRIAGAARADKRGKVNWQVPGTALFWIVDESVPPFVSESGFVAEVCTYRNGKRISLGNAPALCDWSKSRLTARCKIEVGGDFQTRGKLGIILRGVDAASGQLVEIIEYTFPGQFASAK